jgi:hypothetical protein
MTQIVLIAEAPPSGAASVARLTQRSPNLNFLGKPHVVGEDVLKWAQGRFAPQERACSEARFQDANVKLRQG